MYLFPWKILVTKTLFQQFTYQKQIFVAFYKNNTSFILLILYLKKYKKRKVGTTGKRIQVIHILNLIAPYFGNNNRSFSVYIKFKNSTLCKTFTFRSLLHLFSFLFLVFFWGDLLSYETIPII